MPPRMAMQHNTCRGERVRVPHWVDRVCLRGRSSAMSSDTLMLLVAGFPDPELAQKQFDDLVSRVESKGDRKPGHDSGLKGRRRRSERA